MITLKKLLHQNGLILILCAAAVIPIGCSLNESPTASTAEQGEMDLWSPQPGDEVVPGREVPILNDNYWESEYGTEINPLRIRPVLELIGEAGGIIRLGLHSYAVPEGAVDGLVLFTIAYASIYGVAVDCGPSPMTFNTSVTATLSFANTQYGDWEENGLDPTQLQVIYAAPDGDTIPLPSTVDLEAQTVSAEVDHFSRYILG